MMTRCRSTSMRWYVRHALSLLGLSPLRPAGGMSMSSMSAVGAYKRVRRAAALLPGPPGGGSSQIGRAAGRGGGEISGGAGLFKKKKNEMESTVVVIDISSSKYSFGLLWARFVL